VQSSRPQLDELSATAVKQRVRDCLREEARSRDTTRHLRVVLELCDLHAAVRLDDRYEESGLLQSAAAIARRRLIQVSRDLQRQLQREGVPRPTDFAERLAAVARRQRAADPTSGGSGDSAGSFQGDADGGGGFAPTGVPDHGWELVELIQRTIVPDYWARRGGPGVIQYDAMRMALVIRAGTHIHEKVGALLRP
jgi:hypothetical protein